MSPTIKTEEVKIHLTTEDLKHMKGHINALRDRIKVGNGDREELQASETERRSQEGSAVREIAKEETPADSGAGAVVSISRPLRDKALSNGLLPALPNFDTVAGV